MRLDIAASETPGIKQCVLYIAVDGKVTDCVLLNIDYKTLEELAEEEEDEEEEPAQEVFAFTIPVGKKVKKVRNKQKLPYANSTEEDQQVQFHSLLPDILKVKPKTADLHPGESIKLSLTFKPVNEAQVMQLSLSTLVNGAEGPTYRFEVTYAN
jgi:hypothetical protein